MNIGVFFYQGQFQHSDQVCRMLKSESVCIMKHISYIKNFNSNSKICNQIVKYSYIYIFIYTDTLVLLMLQYLYFTSTSLEGGLEAHTTLM